MKVQGPGEKKVGTGEAEKPVDTGAAPIRQDARTGAGAGAGKSATATSRATGTATATKKPVEEKDAFGKADSKPIDTSALEAPALPASESKAPANADPALADQTISALDAIKDRVLRPETIGEIVERAQHLQANPSESVVMTALADPTLKQELQDIITAGKASADAQWTEIQGKMLEIVSPQTVLMVTEQRELSAKILGNVLNGGDILGALSKATNADIATAFNWMKTAGACLTDAESMRSLTSAVVADPQAHMAGADKVSAALFGTTQASSRQVTGTAPASQSAQAARTTTPGGNATRGLNGMMAGNAFALLGEASFDWMLAHAAETLTGVFDAHLKLIMDGLSALKNERKAIVAAIVAQEQRITSLQHSIAAGKEKAERLGDVATMIAFAGACVAIAVAVIAVIIAIVVLVCTCGAGSAVSAWIIVCAVIVLVCAIGTLAVTIAMNISPLLKGAGVICKYLGLKSEQKMFEDMYKTWDENIGSKKEFQYACIALLIIFGIGSMCAGFAMGAGGAMSVSVSVLGVAMKLGTLCALMNLLPNGINLVWSVVNLAATQYVSRAWANAQRDMDVLSRELARLNLRLDELLHAIRKLANDENTQKADAERAEEGRQAVMEHVQKANASLNDVRNAIAQFAAA
ncbi:MAG: hypothetical protein IT381_17075 [Deltaproteobacteria bacterium]|nr:hypothetical protein [Deltaproteobacteria bacterium]